MWPGSERLHKFTQVYTGLHRFTQIYADLHRFTQVYTGATLFQQHATSIVAAVQDAGKGSAPNDGVL